RSIASYIKKHAYSNAKTEDLWAALEEGSGEPVNKLMNSWTQQKGYPVISVKVKDQKLEFNQTQFYSSGSQGDGQWIVPITLSCGSYDARKNFLLQAKSETLDIKEFLGCSVGKAGCGGTSNKDNALCSWIKVNVDQTGFYRVKYEDELAAALRNAIEKKQLSETDRFGILDDSFALSMARKQSFASLLTLLMVASKLAVANNLPNGDQGHDRTVLVCVHPELPATHKNSIKNRPANKKMEGKGDSGDTSGRIPGEAPCPIGVVL
ncbi:hypothetical protein C1H46_039355, partial [Malus baccata]